MLNYPTLERSEAFTKWKSEAQTDPDVISGYNDYTEEQKQLNFPIDNFDSWLLSYFNLYI